MTILPSQRTPVEHGDVASRPSNPGYRMFWVATDTNALSYNDGAAWHALGGGGGGGGSAFAVRTANPPFRFYPWQTHVAGGVTTSGAAWNWTSYLEFEDSTLANFIPNRVYLYLAAQPKTASFMRFIWEFEVCTGADGFETHYASVGGSFVTQIPDYSGGSTILATGTSMPIGADLIASGTRLTGRARISVADTLATLNVRWYLGGYDSDAPACDVEHDLDDYLDGAKSAHTKITPSGSTTNITPAAWGDWSDGAQFIAAAPDDLLLRGVITGDGSNLNQTGHYVQFGVGPAGSETWLDALAVPGRGLLNGTEQRLHRAIKVQSGERVALRAQGTGSNIPHQLLYEEFS